MHHAMPLSSVVIKRPRKPPQSATLPHNPLKASNRLYVYPINGRLISVLTSSPCAAVCALSAALMSVCGISSMGKYCVSTFEERRGSKGARMRRSPSHCTPRKKGCCLISWAPPMRPRRFSASLMRLCEGVSLVLCRGGKGRGHVPPHEVLGVSAELLVRWKVQVPGPVNDLPVRVMCLLSAEWRPADQALEHDRA